MQHQSIVNGSHGKTWILCLTLLVSNQKACYILCCIRIIDMIVCSFFVRIVWFVHVPKDFFFFTPDFNFFFQSLPSLMKTVSETCVWWSKFSTSVFNVYMPIVQLLKCRIGMCNGQCTKVDLTVIIHW